MFEDRRQSYTFVPSAQGCFRCSFNMCQSIAKLGVTAPKGQILRRTRPQHSLWNGDDDLDGTYLDRHTNVGTLALGLDLSDLVHLLPDGSGVAEVVVRPYRTAHHLAACWMVDSDFKISIMLLYTQSSAYKLGKSHEHVHTRAEMGSTDSTTGMQLLTCSVCAEWDVSLQTLTGRCQYVGVLVSRKYPVVCLGMNVLVRIWLFRPGRGLP